MMLVDVVRDAESEYVIYFLLAAYIEAVQFAAKLPEYVKTLPIAGFGDVEMRYQQLMRELHRAAGQPHDNSSPEIRDALHVFDAALCRLAFLERNRESLLAFNVSGSSSRYESQIIGLSSPTR